jgi:hypothetical protein
MRGRFSIGKLRSAALTLLARWGANVFIGACFLAISTFTASQVPAPTSPSSRQGRGNVAKAGKEVDRGSCDAKANDLANPAQETPREADGYQEKISSENGEPTNLTLHASSPEDSSGNDAQGGEPTTDVRRESYSEEPARLNTESPKQCTVSKGSRETEPVNPR